MDKPVVAQKDTDMGDIIGSVVRQGEENQVAATEGVSVGNDAAIPGLVLRPARQINPVFRKGGIGEP